MKKPNANAVFSPGSEPLSGGHLTERRLILRIVSHESREFEGAPQTRIITAHRMGRLRAKSTRFDSIRALGCERSLGERVDGAARVAERSVDPVRPLNDHGEIHAGGARRPALAPTGDAENEQQIRGSARHTLKAQPHAGRLVLWLALAACAAIGPIDLGFDGAAEF